MTDFPIIASVARDTSRFLAAVAASQAAHRAGTIANPVFADLKTRINRTLEEAWDQDINRRFIWVATNRQLPAAIAAFCDQMNSPPSLHTIPLILAKLEATSLHHAVIDAMRAFLREALPLATLFADLKSMITKRQPKPVEDRVATYNAPQASQSAITLVKALLEEITQSSHDELVGYFITAMTSMLERYLTAQAVARAAGKTLPLGEFYGTNPRRSHYNPAAFAVVSRLVVTDTAYGWQKRCVLARDDAPAIIAAMARENADQVREAFIYKNLAKLDSIIETKGLFDRAEVVGRQIALGTLRGSLRLHFKDGARFVVQNSVVWSNSVQGKPFCRYPLTFHDVMLPDGSTLIRPSEKKMNTLFVDWGR